MMFKRYRRMCDYALWARVLRLAIKHGVCWVWVIALAEFVGGIDARVVRS